MAGIVVGSAIARLLRAFRGGDVREVRMSADELNARAAALQAEIDQAQARRGEIAVAAVAGDEAARAEMERLDAGLADKLKQLGEVKLAIRQMQRRAEELEEAERLAADQAARDRLAAATRSYADHARKAALALSGAAPHLKAMEETAQGIMDQARGYMPRNGGYRIVEHFSRQARAARIAKHLRLLGVEHLFGFQLGGSHLGLDLAEQENVVADYWRALARGEDEAMERAAAAFHRNDVAVEKVTMASDAGTAAL